MIRYQQITIFPDYSLFCPVHRIKEYPSLTDVVGHDEVALGRKFDPGPVFDYSSIYDLFKDRNHDIDNCKYIVVSPDTKLEVRLGRSKNSKSLLTLHNGDEIFLRSKEHFYDRETKKCRIGNWASISLDEKFNHNGFVCWKYLKKV